MVINDGQTSRKNWSWLNVRYSPGATGVQPRFSVSRLGIEAGPFWTWAFLTFSALLGFFDG